MIVQCAGTSNRTAPRPITNALYPGLHVQPWSSTSGSVPVCHVSLCVPLPPLAVPTLFDCPTPRLPRVRSADMSRTISLIVRDDALVTQPLQLGRQIP